MNNKKLEVETKDVVKVFMVLILVMAFLLAIMFFQKKGGDKATIFTREDLKKIAELQKMEDSNNTGAGIIAYKDKDGNLMIGWDYGDD